MSHAKTAFGILWISCIAFNCSRSQSTEGSSSQKAAASTLPTGPVASAHAPVIQSGHHAASPPALASSLGREPPIPAADGGGKFAGSPKCPPSMAYIPAGNFTMGSVHKEPESFREDDYEDSSRMEPAHDMKVGAYCIDIVQITQAAYAVCMESKTCTQPMRQHDPNYLSDVPVADEDCHWGEAARREAPVTCVTAAQADGYCHWIGKRLPTEPEWEYAARGHDDRLYPWGDRPEPTDYSGATSPSCKGGPNKLADYCAVGSAPRGKSPFGVLDMLESATDWTSSDLCRYPDHSCKNADGKRIARGGRNVWIAFRHAFDPRMGSPRTGFRCVAAPVAPATAP